MILKSLQYLPGDSFCTRPHWGWSNELRQGIWSLCTDQMQPCYTEALFRRTSLVASFTLFRKLMRSVPPVPLFSEGSSDWEPPPCCFFEGSIMYVFTIPRWNLLRESRPFTHSLYAFCTSSLPLDLTKSRTEGPDSKERRKLWWAGGMYSLISWRNSAGGPTVKWRQVRLLGRKETEECKARQAAWALSKVTVEDLKDARRKWLAACY